MSREISLRKAHQIKKVLTGEIAQKMIKIRQFNAAVRRPSNIDVKKLHEEYRELIRNLLDLKTNITLANVGIYSAIVELEETKSLISFYESLNTTEFHASYKPGTTELIETPIDLGITGADVDRNVAELKAKIEDLTDKIDGYNSNTKITIGF